MLVGVIPGIIANYSTRGSEEADLYALKYVWYTSIAFRIIAIIVTCFLGNNWKYLTDRVIAKIRN